MKKFKLFIENFLVYGLGGIISKIVPLIMVPIITKLMPNPTYFGVSDMSNTIISFASALAILGMYDAMYRIFFDKEDEEFKKKVCSTTIIFTIVLSILTSLLLIIFKNVLAQVFFNDLSLNKLLYIISVAVLVSATNNIISAPTRMQNRKKVFLIVNILSPILSYSIAIPLLLCGQYYIALPLASAVSGIIIEITFFILNKKWFSMKKFDKNILKQLLYIAIPLFPNFIIYWLFNSCDKVMITNLLNIGEAGIYSIGSKIGNLSQLIYTAFAGGWQYFAFSTMKEENQVKSNSLIFEYLAVISFCAVSFMNGFSFFIFKILFDAEYLRGYIVAPYLFMAPLLQMLFQVACNQFLIIKKTWPNLVILSFGAVLNVILNLKLIPILGIEGAAIATLVGYIISDIIVAIILSNMKLMIISKRLILACIIIIFDYIVCRFFILEKLFLNILFVILVNFMLVYLYKNDLINLLKNFSKKDKVKNE